MNKRIVINGDTGEVLQELKQGDKIVTQKQEEYVNNKKRMTEDNKNFINDYGNFIFKVDSKITNRLDNNISGSDLSKLIYCATYLDYDNYLHFDDGQPISKADLKGLIGVSKDIFYKWYNLMVSKKIIIEDKNKLKMNKIYYIKGKLSKNKKYNRIFINSIRKVYTDNKGKNSKSIGNIIKLIPYINYTHNVLCWNPLEENREKVNPITMKELMDIFGEYKGNINKLKNHISNYRINGKVENEPIALFINDTEYTSQDILMFNPFLTFSGKNEDLPTIHNIFIILANKEKNKNKGQNRLNNSNINGLGIT